MENIIEKTALHRFTFGKEERLCSKKAIEKLFAEGSSFLVYPIKVVFLVSEPGNNTKVRAAFSVSKKNFKRAVDRNLIKRRMREAYRLNKQFFSQQITDKQVSIFFIAVNKEMCGYPVFEIALKKALKRVAKEYQAEQV